MSIDTTGVRGHVVKIDDCYLLECGCKVRCDTYPFVVVSCQEHPAKDHKGGCTLWKWENDHSKCKGSRECRVAKEEDNG